MPSRNSLKELIDQSYYHIYNRGVEKRIIFLDQTDYVYFMNLLKRHLSIKPAIDQLGREYRHLRKDVELLAFCLMPNHFHLFVYNKETNGVEQLMRTLATSYSMYFNKKYNRVGTLFQGVYKASEITNDSYLQHITRYIHRNPGDYANYEFSSYKNYVGNRYQEWVHPERILELFNSAQEYEKFVKDYDMLTQDEKDDMEYDFANV